jgi:hypothetical protein
MSHSSAAPSGNLWALPHRLQKKREHEERLSLLIGGVRPASALNDACCTQSFFLLLFLLLCIALGVALAIHGYQCATTLLLCIACTSGV